MGGIHKTLKKWIPKEGRSPVDRKIGDENISTHESLSRRMNPEMPVSNEPVMPMADEEEIKRSKRRTASARGGGRASTIFTDNDRLGP
jgi:hypothetical protein